LNLITRPRRASTAPSKPDLLDFMRRPGLATLLRAFPHFCPVKNPARQQDWHMKPKHKPKGETEK
jgi:hypothetical protein